MAVKRKFVPDFVYVVMSGSYDPLYVVMGDDEAEAIRSDKSVDVYRVPAVALLGSWQPVNDEEVENG